MDIYKSLEGGRAVEERYRAFLERWPVPNEQLRIPTGEGETFVVACGPESAPPLLLFHGAGTNSTMWMGDVTMWCAQFRVYAVDLIGEPGLSAPSGPRLNSEAHAFWLDDVLQGLSLRRASLLGASLGGWLAPDYATRRPGGPGFAVSRGSGPAEGKLPYEGVAAAASGPLGTQEGIPDRTRSAAG